MKLRIEYDIDTSNFTTSCLNAIRDFLSRTNDYELVTDIARYIANSYPSQIPTISRAMWKTGTMYYYFVAHSTLNDLYLIFFCFDGRIGLMVSTEWNSAEEIFFQKDIIYNGFYHNTSNYMYGSRDFSVQYYDNFAYYIPMPTIGTCTKLVANYNSENETVMFSGLEPITYNFSTFTTSQYLSHSICFGNLTKYGHWDNAGGFWYGGDAVCSLELYFRAAVVSGGQTTIAGCRTNTHTSFEGAGLYWQYESNCTRGLDFHKRAYWSWETGDLFPWYDDPFSIIANYPVTRLPDTINHFNRFECFLKINMDECPNRPPIENHNDEYNIDQNTDRRVMKVSDIPALYRHYVDGYKYPILCLFKYYAECVVDGENQVVVDSHEYMIPVVIRKQIWATTTLSDYYVPMVSSIDNVSKGLPTYWSLMPSSRTDSGHTVNDLNNISIISRLYLMVQRDPKVLNDFSCVGYNDVINYVNMKNMSTNRYINGTYPVKTAYYNCFQSGIRRSDLGFKGYAGLAFKMVDQDNEESVI